MSRVFFVEIRPYENIKSLLGLFCFFLCFWVCDESNFDLQDFVAEFCLCRSWELSIVWWDSIHLSGSQSVIMTTGLNPYKRASIYVPMYCLEEGCTFSRACHKWAILQCSLRCHVDIWHNEHLSTKNRTCEYIITTHILQYLCWYLSFAPFIEIYLFHRSYSYSFFWVFPPAKKNTFLGIPETPGNTSENCGRNRVP